MKKLLLILTLFCALNASAQAPAKDTTVKAFYLIMPEAKWLELLALLKTADEKPSKVKEWEQLLLANLRLFEEPKKETKKP